MDKENKQVSVSYKIAKNYFVKNDIVKFDNIKINTKKEFESYFGMASTMGVNGKPTEIDFSKEYVLSVIKSPTNKSLELVPISLNKTNLGTLIFQYKIIAGQDERSFSITPHLTIIVDKIYSGKIEFKEIK